VLTYRRQFHRRTTLYLSLRGLPCFVLSCFLFSRARQTLYNVRLVRNPRHFFGLPD
jgi:hypothetical protein